MMAGDTEGLIGPRVRGVIVLDGERKTVKVETTDGLLGEWTEFLGTPKLN